MIQVRLMNAIDSDLAPTQYGFSKGKSTSNAIACIRRLYDRAESSKNLLCLTLLDWEKAFDRIKQDKLLEELECMDIPTKFLNAIGSLYTSPTFAVKSDGMQSAWEIQKSGIRQGCPRSPHFF